MSTPMTLLTSGVKSEEKENDGRENAMAQM
jgi:hypothetical protein